MTKFTSTLFGLTVGALLLTGCSAGPADLTPTAAPTSSAAPSEAPAAEPTAPVETPAPTEAPAPPAPADPVAEAAADSGLSPEVYAEVTAKADALDTSVPDSYFAGVEALGAEYGKPVVIVANYFCPNSEVTAWGISGALFASAPPGCGSGYAESREATLAKVEERAEVKDWTSDDYIVVFADYVN